MTSKIPAHIAIIMDGNGRWAKQRNLPRAMGHRKGAETVRMVIRACIEMGVSYLTLYVFSRENWKRPQAEVTLLMDLLNHFLEVELEALKREGIRFHTIGDVDALSEPIRKKIEIMKKETQQNHKLHLVAALNYGSRQEILDAVNRCVAQNPGQAVTEREFAAHLDTAGIPDPDLLIRTSGELRLSNFLLWQCSYSEFYVSDKLWPDFSEQDFKDAVAEYAARERRFGAVA